MDRREMMAGVAAAVASLPLKADVSTIEPDPLPLMIVITVDPAAYNGAARRALFAELVDLNELISERAGERIPIMVVENGTTVEAVIDPRVT